MAWNGMVWLLVTRSTRECEKQGAKENISQTGQYMVAWEIKGHSFSRHSSLSLSSSIPPVLLALPCFPCQFACLCLLALLSLVLHLAVVPVTCLTQIPQTQNSQRLVPPSRFFLVTTTDLSSSSLSLSLSLFLPLLFLFPSLRSLPFLSLPNRIPLSSSCPTSILIIPYNSLSLSLPLEFTFIHKTPTHNAVYTHTLIHCEAAPPSHTNSNWPWLAFS
ncbi:MAG: hypothetical protein JOS17DRAFT_456475 [Linnemannia elongata]|nr:MAG: hypothetical protein JOS17DRAFT_456475 [Linnemannia elongata]